MMSYCLRKMLGIVPMLVGISLISFFVLHLSPGSPADVQTQLNQKASLQVRARLEKLYGLDQPIAVQYGQWLSRMLRFDFGRSYIDGQPVQEKIAARLPITLIINILSIGLIYLLAVPIGVMSAVGEGGWFDRIMTVLVFLGFAMPTFWLALLLIKWLGVTLQVVPVSGIRSLDFIDHSPFYILIDYGRHLALPVLITAFTGLAGLSRYTRTSMVEVLRQDYIRTARAKGVPPVRIYFRHALRNSLLPVITLVGLSLPGLFSGSVIAESIFAIPGMGKLFFDAVMSRDYPVIMGILVIGAFMTLVGNLLADILYAWADPRIRLSAAVSRT